MMKTAILIGWLWAGAAAQPDAATELASAFETLASAESYRFEVATESPQRDRGGRSGGGEGREGRGRRGGGEGGVGGGDGERPGRGGGNARGGSPFGMAEGPVVGVYGKGKPVKLSLGDVTVYRLGDQSVSKNADGDWTTSNRDSRGGMGFGRRGGEGGRGGGGGRGGDGERGRGGDGERGRDGERRSSDRGAMMAGLALRSAMIPADAFDGFAKHVTDVVRSDEGGKIIYTGKLTAEGVQSLSPMRGFGGGRGGSGDSSAEGSGDLRIVVTTAGAIESIRVHTATTMSFGERSFDREQTTTVTFDQWNAATVDVPADAMSKFKI